MKKYILWFIAGYLITFVVLFYFTLSAAIAYEIDWSTTLTVMLWMAPVGGLVGMIFGDIFSQ